MSNTFKITYDPLGAFSYLPENQRTAQPWTAEGWASQTVEMLSVRSLGWLRCPQNRWPWLGSEEVVLLPWLGSRQYPHCVVWT